MEYPKVTHLYKFYAYNKHSLSVLINQKVWFSKPATLNDPFDIDIDLHIPRMNPSKLKYMIDAAKRKPGISRQKMKANEDLERSIPNLNRDDYETMKEIFNKISNNQFREDRRNWGVFCMSESNKSIQMWSHYADHHKGFCVEFLRSSKNCLGNLEKTRPITYSCEYPAADPTSDGREDHCYDDLFFTKAKGWAYEKEWRMLNDKGDVLESLPGDITAIIFGLKMPLQHRARIKNILSKTTEIIFQRAERVPKQFKLKIVDCKPTYPLTQKG